MPPPPGKSSYRGKPAFAVSTLACFGHDFVTFMLGVEHNDAKKPIKQTNFLEHIFSLHKKHEASKIH
jgi:hypothetical protein